MLRRLVCLAPFIPHGDIGHAGGVYLHHHLSLLAPRFDVVLFAPDVSENREALAHDSNRPYSARLVPRPLWRRALERPASVLRRGSGSLSGGYWPLWLDRNARRVIAEVDFIEVQWAAYLPLVGVLRRLNPRAVISVVEHEVETQRRQRMLDAAQGVVARRRAALSLRWVRYLESKFLQGCDVVVAFKAEDLAFAASVGGHALGVLTQPYVEVVEAAPGLSHHQHVLFVGAMSRIENEQGVRWLLDEVWPAVLDVAPGAQLKVIGAHPPAWLEGRASASVEVMGYVDDLTPHYAAARVVVAPIRLGGGIKFKIAEALGVGRPVVAVVEAADGYQEVPTSCLVACESPTLFAEAIVRYLLDQDVAKEGVAAAWAWAVDRLDFGGSMDRVIAAYEAASQEGRTAAVRVGA